MAANSSCLLPSTGSPHTLIAASPPAAACSKEHTDLPSSTPHLPKPPGPVQEAPLRPGSTGTAPLQCSVHTGIARRAVLPQSYRHTAHSRQQPYHCSAQEHLSYFISCLHYNTLTKKKKNMGFKGCSEIPARKHEYLTVTRALPETTRSKGM